MTTIIPRLLATTSVALLLSVSSFAAKDELAPQLVEELRGLVAEGRCAELDERIESLSRRERRAPDVLVLDANCRLAEARHVERRFDSLAYERFRLGSGAEFFDPALAERFYRQEVRIDEEAREEAIALFEKALARAPAREDIEVGYVAALVDAGLIERALGELEQFESTLTPRAQQTLASLVGDLLAVGRQGEATRLAEGLAALFEQSPETSLAIARVALAAGERLRAHAALEAASTLPALRLAPLRKATAFLHLLARDYERAVPLLAPLVATDDEALAWLALARDRLAPGSAKSIWNELRSRVLRPGGARQLQGVVEHHLDLESNETLRGPNQRVFAARFFADAGRAAAAVSEADAALAAEPELVDAWAALAESRRAAGSFELAAEAYAEALSRASGERAGELALALGVQLFAAGRDEAALEALRDAEERGAGRPYVEGLALSALGRADDARAAFERAAERNGPDAERARARLARIPARDPA